MVVKMIKLLILNILLLHNVLGSTSVQRQNEINGPISNIMEHLAIHTSTVTDELLSQLSGKIERTSKTIIGNIEVLITSTLNELSAPIKDAQNKINSPECQATFPMDELEQLIDVSLITCTQNLTDILTTFQTDAQEFSLALDTIVKEMVDLPKQCEILDETSPFSGTINCYVEKITEMNQQIAVVLNNASMTLVHTRHVAEQLLKEARDCTDDVVVDILDYLNDLLSKCVIAGIN